MNALCAFVDRELHKPFVWGFRDCHSMALRALDAMVGGSYADFASFYTTRDEAITCLYEFGREIMVDLLRHAGAVEVHDSPRIGDFIVGEMEDFITVMVCLGSSVLTATEKYGVIAFPLSMMDGGYRVFRVVD